MMHETRAGSPRLSNLELSGFCSQFSMILKSGISPAEGASIMAQDAQEGPERDLLSGLADSLKASPSVAGALRDSMAFPEYLCKMAEIGERTGTSDEVFDGLAGYYARQDGLQRSIRSAFTYPVMMCGVMALVVAVLLTRVMPVFSQVFKQLGLEMNSFSRGALALGQGMGRYAGVLAGILAVLVIAGILTVHSETGRQALKGAASHIRAVAGIFDRQAACRFAGVLGIALRSGLSEEEGFKMAMSLNEDSRFADKIGEASAMISRGIDLGPALVSSGMFTGVHGRLVTIAGRTGMLDEKLEELAGTLEQEVDHKTSAFIGMLEPTLVIALSLIVGVILLSVMVPLLGILAGL